MFVCVSLNPALDKRLALGTLHVGQVNRAARAEGAPGGKAAHVAMVLRTLGADPLWLGFTGGSAGAALVAGLRELQIKVEAVAIAGETRTNLEIIEDHARVTEVLEPGPAIGADELKLFQETFQNTLAKSAEPTTVVLSGSVPPGVPSDYYATLIRLAHPHRSRVFLDASGDALILGLAAGPDFVKPNQHEAESVSGSTIHDTACAEEGLKRMMQLGAKAAAISLGAEGIVWRSEREERTLIARVPKQVSRSCVGSGDATVAGFAYAAAHSLSPVGALRLAAACGVANCLADAPGRARAADIARMKDEIRVDTLAGERKDVRHAE
jgi:1-phosphofructokinase family hexose kinase